VKRIRMSIQRLQENRLGISGRDSRAMRVCGVLHAQSTLQDKPVPSQSDATQKLQERVTQLESEVSELSALVKQLQPSGPVPAADQQSAVVHESVQGQAPRRPSQQPRMKDPRFFPRYHNQRGSRPYYAYNFNRTSRASRASEDFRRF